METLVPGADRHSGTSSISVRLAAFGQIGGHGRLLHRGVDRIRLAWLHRCAAVNLKRLLASAATLPQFCPLRRPVSRPPPAEVGL